MAALQHSGIPRVKLESVPHGDLKQESTDQDVDMTSPQAYMDDDGDELEDGGDLDFTNAQQQLWLTKIPRPLWETWSTMGLDDEIELGTIRVEGPEDNPLRVRLPDITSSFRANGDYR
jgi:transcription initiation factor TFIIF subunit beta